MARPKKKQPTKKKTAEDTTQSLIYPEYTRPTSSSGHGNTWETPDYFYGTLDSGSMWLKLEITYSSKPAPGYVEGWLRQVLAFEIGQPLARKALELMKSRRGEFGMFIEEVTDYLKDTRTPKRSRRSSGPHTGE